MNGARVVWRPLASNVIAVAITLLVLNIAVPEPHANAALLNALAVQWPNYLGYVTSFLVISIIWINHHHLFRYLKRIDQGLLLLNILFLLFVGLIPFVTALVTRYLQLPDEHTAAIAYSVTLLLVSVTASLILYMFIAVFYALPVDHFLEKMRKRDEQLSPSDNAKSGVKKED